MEDICTGNVYICDQTIACDECGEELWNYPGIEKLKLTVEQYEERFFIRHPFMFEQAHDDGDEDPNAHDQYVPIGGFTASYNRYTYGNAIEKYIR